jgi:hypothetical protein
MSAVMPWIWTLRGSKWSKPSGGRISQEASSTTCPSRTLVRPTEHGEPLNPFAVSKSMAVNSIPTPSRVPARQDSSCHKHDAAAGTKASSRRRYCVFLERGFAPYGSAPAQGEVGARGEDGAEERNPARDAQRRLRNELHADRGPPALPCGQRHQAQQRQGNRDPHDPKVKRYALEQCGGQASRTVYTGALRSRRAQRYP